MFVCALAASLLLTTLAGAAAPGAQFQPYQAYAVGSWPAAVAIGDVTGDGRNDVVLTTDSYFDPANDYRVWVFAQTSGGALAAPVSYPSSAGTSDLDSVAVGDITGDGRRDVVVGSDSAGVQVFPQLASGTLGAPALYPTANGRQIRLGQLNGDGRLDVAAIGWGTNTVSVLLNDGAGGLQAPVEYAAQHSGYDDLEVGDVTGDARADLVVMSGQLYATPNVSVLSQLAGGGFASPASYSIGQNVLTSGIGVGDVTGDGRNDVVASYGGNRPGSNLAVFTQTATGTLAPPVSYPSYDIPEPVELADVDLDGRTDVVTLHGGWNRAGLYRQMAGGGLGAEELYPIPYASHYEPHGLAVGDLDGNGSPDMALADYNNGLVVLRNVAAVPPPPPPSADMGVSLKASAATVKPKKSFWVDATVRNAGPNSSGASLTMQLGGSPSNVSVSSSSCAVQAATVTCSFASLAAGGSATIRISGNAPNKGAVTASASVHGAVSDPNPANDSASLSISVR
jgi:Domain of unknown function DUF11/FG-GAP-like repeat